MSNSRLTQQNVDLLEYSRQAGSLKTMPGLGVINKATDDYIPMSNMNMMNNPQLCSGMSNPIKENCMLLVTTTCSTYQDTRYQL